MTPSSLRSIIPQYKVIVLTATATAQAQGKICEALLMKQPSLVAVSPDWYELIFFTLHPYNEDQAWNKIFFT